MLRTTFAVLAGLVLLTSAPVRAADPILVVFPFAQSEGIADGMGASVVDKIAVEMTAAGGITVVRGSLSAKPSEYRSLARATGADFFLSGSIVPVGAGYSAIEQLITTRGGTAAFSTTFQFRSIADIRGEGAKIRDEVLLNGKRPAPPAP